MVIRQPKKTADLLTEPSKVHARIVAVRLCSRERVKGRSKVSAGLSATANFRARGCAISPVRRDCARLYFAFFSKKRGSITLGHKIACKNVSKTMHDMQKFADT
jgi:hypothetical protein